MDHLHSRDPFWLRSRCILRLEETYSSALLHELGHDFCMKLFYLVHRTLPSPSLSKGIGHVYDRISSAVSSRYLGFPVLETHSQTALIYMHESLLFESFFINQPRSVFDSVHKLAYTFADVFHRLSKNSFKLRFYLRGAGQHGNQESHYIHVTTPNSLSLAYERTLQPQTTWLHT